MLICIREMAAATIVYKPTALSDTGSDH